MSADRFAGRPTRNIRQDHRDPLLCVPNSAGYCPCPLESADESVAELVCSDVGEGMHLPVIDLDLPASLVPSATPGHHHLYLDTPVTWEQYRAILKALAEAGIVQWGYHDSTVERGFGSVRHPDRPKQVKA